MVPIRAPDFVATRLVARVVPSTMERVRPSSPARVCFDSCASFVMQSTTPMVGSAGVVCALLMRALPFSSIRTPSVKVPPLSTEIL